MQSIVNEPIRNPRPSGLRQIYASILLTFQRSEFVRPGMRRAILNHLGARIHPTADIWSNCHFGSARIEMGPYAVLNKLALVSGDDWLILGERARVGSRVTFQTRTHAISDNPRARRADDAFDIVRPIHVGAGSWIGTGATILPGCDIAPGCVVGANALVVESTEPNGQYVNAAGEGGAVRARRVRDLPTGSN